MLAEPDVPIVGTLAPVLLESEGLDEGLLAEELLDEEELLESESLCAHIAGAQNSTSTTKTAPS